MPVFGVERERELGWQGVFRIAPGGGDPQLVVEQDEYEQPNGLCFSPDESLLYINDTPKAPASRSTTSARTARSRTAACSSRASAPATIEEGIPDGMKCDEQGNIWVTGPGGVWVISADGEHLGDDQDPREHRQPRLGRLRLAHPVHPELDVAVRRRRRRSGRGASPT